MSKTLLSAIALIFLCAVFSGCGLTKPLRSKPAISPAAAKPYSGRKAKLAVKDIVVKNSAVSAEAIKALQEMLVTGLTRTNRFMINEAAQPDNSAPPSTPVKPKAKSRAGNMEIGVKAVLKEFRLPAAGGRSGVGGGGSSRSGLLGGLLRQDDVNACVTLEISVFDNTTNRIFARTQVSGRAGDISGSSWAGFLGAAPLDPVLSEYADTPTEKAIRLCLVEAIRLITREVPTTYYRY